MLVDAREPRARSAVHMIFVREKVRSEYLEAVPDFSTPVRTSEGVLLAPVADLVRMKLTSYRLKDRVHIQDLDAVALITPEIEVLDVHAVLQAIARELHPHEVGNRGEKDPFRRTDRRREAGSGFQIVGAHLLTDENQVDSAASARPVRTARHVGA